MIDPAKLDRRITIERETTTLDEYRQPRTAWTPIASVRAELVTLATEEAQRTFGEEGKARATFRIRWIPGETINEKDRLVHAGRVFNIRGHQEIGRRQGLELYVEAVS